MKPVNGTDNHHPKYVDDGLVVQPVEVVRWPLAQVLREECANDLAQRLVRHQRTAVEPIAVNRRQQAVHAPVHLQRFPLVRPAVAGDHCVAENAFREWADHADNAEPVHHAASSMVPAKDLPRRAHGVPRRLRVCRSQGRGRRPPATRSAFA